MEITNTIDAGSVTKFVFEANDAVAEAVLYRYPTYTERTVLCISTQSGCPVGCSFCGAGDGFVRSLRGREIVGQVRSVLASRRIDADAVQRLQIMFMSMGEPLLNQSAVCSAIRQLNSDMPHAELLISTMGPDVPYGPLFDVSADIGQVGLQFSVHESSDAARGRLIPFERKLTLRQIAEKGCAWHNLTGRRPYLNYCAHEGNSSTRDADRLAMLFDPRVWCATVSVICERDELVCSMDQSERTGGFARMLRANGFDTRVFDPAGQDDCGGGCGQLWHVQRWMRNHHSLVWPRTWLGRAAED